MSPEEQRFLDQFENLTLDPAEFDHTGHVRLAWLYLQKHSFDQADSLISEGINRYATSLGAKDKFHRTLTHGFTHLIAERLHRNETFTDFLKRNEILMTDAMSLIQQHYSAERLATPHAKQQVVEPDLKSFSSHGTV